ncbi:MAG: Bug family tripartite tricarboxylate transporter substrate binding protein [Alphaproteobacteria bacterium]|jgi:tripartite-type tricarboxylate transporter receptor subunit TctC
MTKFNKITLLAGAALAVFGLTAVAPATVSAADFPSKPVQLQVPFAPGGGADRTFRLFAPYLSEELGVPVKVTNVAGGGGWVSWGQVVNDWNAKRDDHKLAVVNIPHIFSFLNPQMKRTEKLESFNFLAWHSYDPGLWLVRWDDERFKNLDDVLNYAQKQAIIVAPGSFGSDDHIGVAFAQQAVPGFKAKFVTSKGDNSKIQLLLGKHVDMVAANVGYFIPSIMERKLRPIVVLHNEPWAVLPSVPTFEELTGKVNITYAGRTIATANGLEDEKRAVYLDAISKAIVNPEYVAKEAANKNHLLFKTGDDMWKLLREGQQVAEQAAYWKQEGVQ